MKILIAFVIAVLLFAGPAIAQRMKLVDGQLVPVTAAEEAQRDKEDADYLTRVDPLPVVTAQEILDALKVKGVLTDVDVGR